MSAKDAVATMGDILPDDAGGRDAVHVAVVSCVATAILKPGQDIGIGEQTGRDYEALASAKHIGRVDPFLKATVLKGQRFWLYLYPRSITGLNHQWTHPAFPAEDTGTKYAPPSKKLAAEQWLRNFASTVDVPSYEEMMSAAMYTACKDSHGVGFGTDASGEIPDEFWEYFEAATGLKPPSSRPTRFSCAC